MPFRRITQSRSGGALRVQGTSMVPKRGDPLRGLAVNMSRDRLTAEPDGPPHAVTTAGRSRSYVALVNGLTVTVRGRR